MTDLIATDHPLGATGQAVLAALLDTLVPASADGRMPSAATLDFAGFIGRGEPGYLPALRAAVARFEPAFAGLALDQRVAAVDRFSSADPAGFQQLLVRVYDCYYQDDRVRRAIGMVTGPVFPQGNTVIAGDLALLDPVIRDAARHRFRPA